MADWQVGDLALCVKRNPSCNIRIGSAYCVKEVFFVEGALSEDGPYTGTGLCFVEAPDWNSFCYGYRASLFVKITPGAEVEGVEVDRKVPTPKRVKQDA